MSKMNATMVMKAAIPEMQLEQQVMDISRTCANSPNTAEIAAAMRATTCKKSAYVIHFTTTSGTCANRILFCSRAFGSMELMMD
jgi:hypothetical protein